MLKNITIFKRSEVKTDKHPTHDIVAADENYSKESKTTVGSLWTKTTDDGSRFLSGGLSKSRTHEGKEYDGYVIISEKEYNALKGTVKQDDGSVAVEDIPF